MKFFTGAAVAVIAFATSLAISEPAAARNNIGVYVGPDGIAISVDTQKRYCRDEYYRRRHWDRCSRYYGRYYNNDYYRDRERSREHRRHRHWNEEHRRWEWD
jgi:hypothetical protein